MNRDEIRNSLKHRLRATNARLGVANFLSSSDRPLSHSELVQELSEQYGDQATIYRTLITFVEKGLIRIASNVGGISRYEFIKKIKELPHRSIRTLCVKPVELSLVSPRPSLHHPSMKNGKMFYATLRCNFWVHA